MRRAASKTTLISHVWQGNQTRGPCLMSQVELTACLPNANCCCSRYWSWILAMLAFTCLFKCWWNYALCVQYCGISCGFTVPWVFSPYKKLYIDIVACLSLACYLVSTSLVAWCSNYVLLNCALLSRWPHQTRRPGMKKPNSCQVMLSQPATWNNNPFSLQQK